ncbi:6-phosphogluconolactonase [Edwardsiella piscicida]|nr:6-phosphogluconolactonase [Edwardsiella piscicida]ELM3727503.1 6-phosphogluconolactonase [Edwardsiella piscicida]ELV7536916.1 6-phosphogluconolactonase [Edwardsiella piscicida]
MAHFIEFGSADALNTQLAQAIAERLRQGIAARGQASLVVSGGRTPLGLFAVLREQTLDWSRVWVTLADERWVGADDEASNETLVRANLLQGPAAAAHFIGLKNDAAAPFDGAKAAEAALAAIARPFDALILGMGDDGHTASLFPGAENLFPALAMDSGRVCMGMTPLTAPLDRITLTLPALLDSRHIYLHLVGNAKRRVYEQAAGGAEVNEMPIRAVLQQSMTPVDVYWTA